VDRGGRARRYGARRRAGWRAWHVCRRADPRAARQCLQPAPGEPAAEGRRARCHHHRGGRGVYRSPAREGAMSADVTAPPTMRSFDEGRGRQFGRAIFMAAPVFVVLFALFVWITIENPNFTNPPVFLIFLRRAAPLMILAAGQLFVIISGEFDLSMGALITLVVILAGDWIDGDPSMTWPIIAVLLLIGVAVGLANGVITTRLGVPSFITTLGMMLILSGFALWWSGGTPKGSLPDNFRQWGRTGIQDVPWITQLPWSVIIMWIVMIACVYLL